jgi:hypothetical protein
MPGFYLDGIIVFFHYHDGPCVIYGAIATMRCEGGFKSGDAIDVKLLWVTRCRKDQSSSA